MENVFCDTSFFFASLNQSDPNHLKAKNWLKTFDRIVLTTTWDIVSETITLLRYRSDYRLALNFLEKVVPQMDVIACDQDCRDEAIRIFKKFSRDKRLSFCDCLSFVVLTNSLPGTPVFTFDADFKTFGFSIPDL